MKNIALISYMLFLSFLLTAQSNINKAYRFSVNENFEIDGAINKSYQTIIPLKLCEYLDNEFLVVGNSATYIINYKATTQKYGSLIDSTINPRWVFYNHKVQGTISSKFITVVIINSATSNKITIVEEWSPNKKLDAPISKIAKRIKQELGSGGGIKDSKVIIKSKNDGITIRLNQFQNIKLDKKGNAIINAVGTGGAGRVDYEIISPNGEKLEKGKIKIWSRQVNRYKLTKSNTIKRIAKIRVLGGFILRENSIDFSSSIGYLHHLFNGLSVGISAESIYTPSYPINYTVLSANEQKTIEAEALGLYGNILLEYNHYFYQLDANLTLQGSGSLAPHKSAGIKMGLGLNFISNFGVEVGYKWYEIPVEEIAFNQFGNAIQTSSSTNLNGLYIGLRFDLNF